MNTRKEQPFRQTLGMWLQSHQPTIADRTYRDYQQYCNPLIVYFDGLPLSEITLDSLRGFQMWRWKDSEQDAGPKSKYKHAAGSLRVKNEINSCLKPLLREAGIWDDIAARFKHLPVSRDGAGFALDPDEQQQIFTVAFSRESWQLAAHLLVIMYRTGASFGELRKLRHKDIDTERGTISVILGAKNRGSRIRTVALVPIAHESLKWLFARWQRLGGTHPDEFLLPHRSCLTVPRKPFTRPMTSINFAWTAIRNEWVKQYPPKNPLKCKLRLYDSRVTVASALLSNPSLSLPTIERTLGWTPSSAMRKRYYRCDENTQRAALATLDTAAPLTVTHHTQPQKQPKDRVYRAAAKIDAELGKLADLVRRLKSKGVKQDEIAAVLGGQP